MNHSLNSNGISTSQHIESPSNRIGSKAPCFSVVIPVYNVEEYIEECIESVLAQTFQDYEIVLVDDGSPDNSGAICDRYAMTNKSKIRVIHQDNQGLLLARQAGFRAIRGCFVVSLDSDDKLRPDALQVLFEIINKTEADIIFFNASRDIDFSTPFIAYPYVGGEVFERDRLHILRVDTIKGTTLNNLCLKAISSRILDKSVDYSVFRDVSLGEDILQFLRYLDAAQRVAYCSENLYYYRPNDNSITRRFSKKRWVSVLTVGQEKLSYAQKWDTDGSLIRFGKMFYIGVCCNEVRALLLSELSYKEKRAIIHEMLDDERYRFGIQLAKEEPLIKDSFELLIVYYFRGVLTLIGHYYSKYVHSYLRKYNKP